MFSAFIRFFSLDFGTKLAQAINVKNDYFPMVIGG